MILPSQKWSDSEQKKHSWNAQFVYFNLPLEESLIIIFLNPVAAIGVF